MIFKEIQDEVIWNLNKAIRGISPTDTGLIASVKLWINRCQNRVCQIYSFYFMQDTNPDVFTVADDQTYPLSSFSANFKEPLHLALKDGTNVYKLTRREGLEVKPEYFTTTIKGKPTDYWIWENEIWLYPIPDKVYTLQLKSYNYLPSLSADTDTNEITSRFPGVLIYGACKEGASWLQEDMTIWEGEYRKALSEMVAFNNRKANQDRKIKMEVRIK